MKQEIGFCKAADGTSIAYASSGTGPPFVKVANYLSHLEYDWNSPVWRHWLQTFSSHHTLVRYDTRGCGLSDWEIRELGMDAWVSDLEAVVDALGLDKFPLFGMSQGGSVACMYARRHPEKVTHLILYGAYARGRSNRNLSTQEKQEAQALLKLMEVGWGQDTPAFRNVFTTLFLPEGTPEQINWFNTLQQKTASPFNAVQLEKAFFDINVSDFLEDIHVPTLVIHARHDAMVAFEEGEKLASKIPQARFVALQGNNHILLEDEPAWGDFLREVYNFIDRPELAPRKDLQVLERIGFESLTDRERQVLELLARGFKNTDIANHLFLTPKTVRNYLSNIFGKLGVSDRGEAIVLSREEGYGKRP